MIMLPVCPIFAILFLVLIVLAIKLVFGIFRHGVLRAAMFGFVLLVVFSMVALVASIGQGFRYVNSGGTVHIQQEGNSVKVSPSGVEVRSRAGESVSVGPLGVQVNSGTESVREDASTDTAVVITEQEDLPAPALLAEAPEPSAAVQAEAPDDASNQQTAASTRLPPQQRLFSDLDGELAADIYPSDAAAVRALVAQEAKGFRKLIPDEADPERIEVCAAPEARKWVPQALLLQAAQVLRKAYPEAEVAVVEGPSPDKAPSSKGKAVLVRLFVATPTDPVFTPVLHLAPVNVESFGPLGHIARSAKYSNKPWADDFALFLAHNPGHNWIVAMSEKPATSADEAQNEAIGLLAQKLEPLVAANLSVQRGARGGATRAWLQERIREELMANGSLISDRFVQRMQRTYGEFWQAAMLIDSPKAVAELSARCGRLLAAQEGSLRRTALSIAGVVALVCVVYIFLNSVTKGYFVWSLRAAAIAIIAGGVFLVLLLSHNEPVIDGFLR